MRLFCVGKLVHASLVRELVYASFVYAWSPKNRDQIQASHWRSKVDPKSGGQKWTPKAAVKKGTQKWRSKVDPKSGGFFASGNWCMRPSSENWCMRPSPSRGALKMGTRSRPLIPFPFDFFCVRELVHVSLVQELVHASVAHAWSPKNRDQIQASNWQSKVDPKSGGQKWTPKVAAKSGGQEWRPFF